MNDIIKDPIQPNGSGATPYNQPQPAKSNNTALIFVIIIIVLICILPIVFMGFLGYFFGSFIEKLDSNIYGSFQYNSELTEDQAATFKNLWVATRTAEQAKNGISSTDCENVRSVAEKMAYIDEDFEEGVVYDIRSINYCADGTLKVSANWEEDEGVYSFNIISDDGDCTVFQISDDYTALESFKIGDGSGVSCNDAIDLEVIDVAAPTQGDDNNDDDAPFTENSVPETPGTVRTNSI